MQTRLPILLLLLGFLWLGNTQTAQASHILGGELTYENLVVPSNPNLYRVRARVYRDYNTQVDFGQQLTLKVTKNGCAMATAGSFTATLNRISALANGALGCTPGTQYQITVFEGLIELPPGRWLMNIDEANRSFGIRNLIAAEYKIFHLSAYLDNSSGLRNSSPKFNAVRLPYAAGNQLHRFSFSAFDTDGDSLVYTSVQPQSSVFEQDPCATDIDYAPYAAGSFQDPATGQTVSYPARTYSAAQPLFSFRVSNGVATPYFELNPATGELLTLPIRLQSGQYVVAVRVDELRKLNGSWVKIGSIMRDVYYTVFNGGTNQNPVLTSLTTGTNQLPLPLNRPIPVAPGQTIVVTLNATDPNAGQTVWMGSDAADLIPGATFQRVADGQGRLTWQVPATLKPGRYGCTITIEDNFCPLVGNETVTLTFLVGVQPLATKNSQNMLLAAFPMPFHDQVQFQLATRATQTVVISDELGREVSRLSSRPDGLVIWQPAATVAPGLYFARSLDGRQVARLLRADSN
ncbi:hypothetical protein LGH74_05070 [Hymenobacter sp. BT178]|uniref:T9SS type A sorting domain-containing protein n=1 Tax=Hymenobacter lucidus TaxID=2880930 RepID=A0ABS8AMR5_9BACT|nr:hypothetical protein [Hymenobacter lucidus]